MNILLFHTFKIFATESFLYDIMSACELEKGQIVKRKENNTFMNWENYFTKTIIARARNYYERGLVLDVEKKGNRYVAQVIGSIPYNVSVWKKANHQLNQINEYILFR